MPVGDVVLKTAVNTRMPLAQRLPRKATGDERVTTVAPLHNPLESTYDVDYTATNGSGHGIVTQRTVADCRNRFSPCAPTSGDGGGPSTSGTGAGAACSRDAFSTSVGPFDGESDRVANSAATARSVNNNSAAGAEPAAVATVSTRAGHSHPSSAWESEAHAASRAVQPQQCLNFYSSVRKEEGLDDERRSGLIGASQRCVEITMKRLTAPQMQPPQPVYRPADRVEMPLAAAQEKCLIQRNYLDLVECAHTMPDTEQQIGYDVAPEARLPGMDLSWDLPVQSKAITRMGTTRELFKGSPKCLEDRPAGYAGHVPVADHNLAALHQGDDPRRVYAKAIMTLAQHGGGVDATITSTNLRARHRAGKKAPAPKMLKPKSEDAILSTMEGSMLHQSVYQIVDKERTMNFRDDKQSQLYF